LVREKIVWFFPEFLLQFGFLLKAASMGKDAKFRDFALHFCFYVLKF